MNILIPHTWLLEHLETAAAPKKIQELLSLSGPSIERIYDREGEKVYDIEVTTNRVDSMSVRGIAREAAVILEHAGVPAMLKPLSIPVIPAPAETNALPLPQITDQNQLCKRVMCVVLSSVQHTATPDWMGQRLTQIEQNIHDSVIDITNYITHELGHPCHAFDYDKIMQLGGVIQIVTAAAGKKFVTLDGAEYQSLGGEIVFENDTGEIIDLPAIKGTLNTAVDSTTKSVLLWIESLPAEKVRTASMSHAIRTVAAQLNEKNVDPVLAADVLARGVELYQSLCQAVVASPVYDAFPIPPVPAPVSVPLQRISDYLGITLEVSVIKEILTQLGCSVSATETVITVTPPTFRPDITIPADVIEEVARIYGYHKLPSVLMDTLIPTKKPTDTNFELEHRCKTFLVDQGYQELYTYSLVSTEVAEQSGYPTNEHLKLQNPLTDDRVYLRRSLLPSLQEIIAENSAAQTLSVFEVAHVYHPQAGKLPEQVLQLSLVSPADYQTTRGVVEALLRQFFILEVSVQPSEKPKTAGISGEVTTMHDGKQLVLGYITVLPTGQTAVELTVANLVLAAQSHPTYQPISKFAPLKEDLTFTLPEKTAVGPIIAAIRASSTVIKSVEIASVYQRNVTFSIMYHDAEQSLSSEAIEPLRKTVVALVQNDFKAALVGTLA